MTQILLYTLASRQYGAISDKQVDIIQKAVKMLSRRQKSTLQLQLGLVLSLLKHRVKLGRLHNVALNLELAAHEETLGVGLASDELAKVLLGEDECDWRHLRQSCMFRVRRSASESRRTIRLCTGASSDLAGFLEVDMPAGLFTARVLEGEGVDAVALLDGILAIGITGVDSRLDGVEGG